MGWDRYAYTLNNPTNRIDPSGHDDLACETTGCNDPELDKRDLTSWKVAAAVDIAESIKMKVIAGLNSARVPGGKIVAYSYFASLVAPMGKYDVKIEINTELGSIVKLGENWYHSDTPGNTLFGFYGLAAGFTEFELHGGAGAAQIYSHNKYGVDVGEWTTSFDLVTDYIAIEFGFFLYYNYYQGDRHLSEIEFLEALDVYGLANRLALESPPEELYIPAEEEYDANKFYR